jgi:hypothetical protein
MPTLDFKGKSFVYTHHLSVPFRELVVDAKKSLPAGGSKPGLDDNLIIHGDNLHALKAFAPDKRVRKMLFKTDQLWSEIACYEPGQSTVSVVKTTCC